MTPKQIQDHVQRVLDALTAAYGSVELLSDYLEDAAKQSTLDPVIFTDIKHDLSLPKLQSDVGQLYNILENARYNLLTDHLDRLSDKPAIRTTYVYPPIPIRTSDWCACIDGQEEDGPYGWGATEADAIADLKEKLEDAA